MQRIALFGATGSIGQQTLALLRAKPQAYTLESIAAYGKDPAAILQIIKEFQPRKVAVISPVASAAIQKDLPAATSTQLLQGTEAMNYLAADPQIDTVVIGVSGLAGIEPTLVAIKNNKKVITANKETLVAAGPLLDMVMADSSSEIIPADSEHVAVHQCLHGTEINKVQKAYLTASGGPFHNDASINLAEVKPEQALKHPTWQMGRKISIDSATLMNKGLEVLEAQQLFRLPLDKIEVLVHPQSQIHALVEFIDGSILAQLSANDMRLPIQYGLDYPDRQRNLSGQRLNLLDIGKLEFQAPDTERFPCLRLAYQVARAGKSYPLAMVAADEVAVELFLQEQITFTQIPELIDKALQAHQPQEITSLQTLWQIDDQIRQNMMHWAMG